MGNPPLLEFLIPTYKRFDGAVKAAVSIASQVQANSLDGIVSVRIVDDASPGFSLKCMSNALCDWQDIISIYANESNKGMSLNIYDMVSSSKSLFCTVLTDDDWLFPGTLIEIIRYLECLVVRPHVGGLFTPRYSYLEDGTLHCVVCRPFNRDKLLSPGPVNSLRYSSNGFILTGFIFRPALMAKADWEENIQNSFFPVINFGGILASHSLLFVNRNWFRHTVLNVCHWEAWGDRPEAQRRRLYTDYMDAIAFIAERSCCSAGSFPRLLAVSVFEIVNYLRQISSYLRTPRSDASSISRRVAKRKAYGIAAFFAPARVLYSSLRHITKSLLKPILKGLSIDCKFPSPR